MITRNLFHPPGGAAKSFAAIFIFTMLWLPASQCRKARPEPPDEVKARYFADADRFCHAIVECMKQDIIRRVDRDLRRRDLILSRMNQDLCIKNQYHLIGDLSVSPYGHEASLEEELYQEYHNCAEAVGVATTCQERLQKVKENESCRKIRKEPR